ncbi:MAG: DUF116 domain-containing protein [Desulfobacterota bacterium]|nr:DUF116 domain-containing protein [Thermodesulfobacteriota bacterium]
MNDARHHRIEESNGIEADHQPDKRIFLLLLLLTCGALIVVAVALWLIPYIGFTNIHPRLPLIMAIVFAAIVAFLIGGGLTLLFTILRGKNLFFNKEIRGVVIRFLFPLLVLVGKCIGISKDQVRRSFVTINNQLVLAEARRIHPNRLLILLPQCLQFHECGVRITGNVKNCKACGKCKIKNLVELSDKYGVSISVATGGTLARKIVVDKKPQLIIGVACERDLTSGIQDTYPIPVFGILNKRPNGPCYDTDVDLDLVERGMESFLIYEGRDTKGSRPEGAERPLP